MDHPDQISAAIAMIPSPVAALTVAHGKERNGMIASWLTPVSGDPPQVAVAVRHNRFSHHLIENAGYFVLNILAEEQRKLVPQFKLKGSDREAKFADLPVETDDHGQPYLPDSAAVLHCRLDQQVQTGDHTLFIGTVWRASWQNAKPMTTLSLGKSYSGK